MKRVAVLLVHWAIIINFLVEMAYAGYVIFVVLKPPNHDGGPLWARAAEVPFEFMTTRRLYATEFWIATAGLSIYLAITWIGPHMWAAQTKKPGASA
jgi:hypothetical protein